MNKLWVFFVFVFTVGTFLCAILDGSGGLAVSKLKVAMTAADVDLTVDNAQDFLDASVTFPAYIVVGTEIIKYTGRTITGAHVADQLTGLTRGVSDPQTGRVSIAATHAIGVKVVTIEVDALDTFMGYDITSSTATFGAIQAIQFVGNLFKTLPKMIAWDYSFLTGQLIYLKFFILYPLSAGLVISLILALASLAQGIFN
jgi:hypothetical protein